MDVATTSGIVGMATGLGGLIFGGLAWRRSGRALDESRWTPVRQAQHEVLDAISDQAKELMPVLDSVNTNIQQREAPALKANATAVERLAVAITDRVIADRELDTLIGNLKAEVLTGVDSMDQGFLADLARFGSLLDKVSGAQGGSAKGAFDLGSEHGRTMEPLRERNWKVVQQVEAIRQRVEHLATYGLGPNPKPVRK